ncbi:glycosyltransferase family A protein [Persicobacter sp. CCB-QB2]|uniref:glycosyltransferase family 2 protein n=1 Tax=Persicobacter sp. CCB-QB2 TaxID=1561025 RepID=UPI0006A974DC|nr:glycosyltransferase family A protein [Persicobacter sp. CCB-QB2]
MLVNVMTDFNVIFTVVIPVYNAAPYIYETIHSVIHQSNPSFEIICVDDCSSDDSVQIIKALQRQYPGKISLLENEKNSGPAISRNRGIAKARGEFILPLDADDLIHPEYCEKALRVFSTQDCGVVYCQANFFNEKGEWHWNLGKFNPQRIWVSNMVFATAFFRKSDWEEIGGYNVNMDKGFEDWDLWLSFVEKGRKFYQIPDVLFYYRQLEGSRTCSANLNKVKMYDQIKKNHQAYFKRHRLSNKYLRKEMRKRFFVINWSKRRGARLRLFGMDIVG